MTSLSNKGLFLIFGLIFCQVWAYAQSDKFYTDYYQVKVNGQAQEVYYGRPGALLSTEISEGTNQIDVQYPGEILEVEIIPQLAHIEQEIQGNVLRLEVKEACQFFLKINGNYVYPLMVAVEQPIHSPPKATLTFEAGVHQVGELRLASNTRLHLKRGAILKGTVVVEDVHNVHIFGAGLIHGSAIAESSGRAGLLIKNAREVIVEGISLIDAPHQHMVLKNAEEIRLRNIKVLGNRELRMGDDALEIFNSKGVKVTHLISNTRNNSIAFMSENEMPSQDIQVDQAVFWKGDYGNVIEVGYLAEGIHLKDVSLRNIYIAHCLAGAAVAIQGKEMKIEGMKLENVQIYDSRLMLYNIQLEESCQLRQVLLKDHEYSGAIPAYSVFQLGRPENAAGFSMEGISYRGNVVRQLDDLYVKSWDFDWNSSLPALTP
ncbi:glycosyl hydrolase family 28 protein [Persicobacter diffluens]